MLLVEFVEVMSGDSRPIAVLAKDFKQLDKVLLPNSIRDIITIKGIDVYTAKQYKKHLASYSNVERGV